MDGPTYTSSGLGRRGARVILVVVIALAVVGYVVGLRAGVPDGPPGLEPVAASPTPIDTEPVVPAPSYDAVGAGLLRARSGHETWALRTAALRAPAAEPVTDMRSREDSLGARSERRAFNGAPPVIPHAAHALDDRSCLACHGQDLRIGARTAKALPHPYLTNCTQCHVPGTPSIFEGLGGMLAENGWQGIAAPKSGPRATPGAPPSVPHTLQMRDNCLACHGPHGWPGMQTTHPERQSCLQCHAPTQDGAHPGRGLGMPFLLPGPKVVKGPTR